MGRFGLAFKAFFGILFNGETADRVRPALTDEAGDTAVPPKAVEAPKPAPPPRNTCSEALLLLAALQREARLVDFVREPIDAYSDEQVGAAVREIHRESAKVLDRVFGLKPIRTEEEGTEIELPADYDAQRYRLTGAVGEGSAVRGRLVHAGWEATTCTLPSFAGEDEAAKVIAAAEVEVG